MLVRCRHHLSNPFGGFSQAKEPLQIFFAESIVLLKHKYETSPGIVSRTKVHEQDNQASAKSIVP